jgi:four helix bundle protein
MENLQAVVLARAIRSYRDLSVWERGMDLAVASYSVARSLPQVEKFALAAQIRRACVSIPANVAEGYGRRHLGDYLRHLYIANGSLKELETEIMLTERLGYCTADVIGEPLQMADVLGRMLGSLCRKLARSNDLTPKTKDLIKKRSSHRGA